MELYPAYLLFLGLGLLMTFARLYRDRLFHNLVQRLPPLFLIILAAFSAVYSFGWLPVYVYLAGASAILGLVLTHLGPINPDVEESVRSVRWFKSLKGMYLMLVSAATVAALAESNLLSPPLILSIPLATAATLFRLRNLSTALALMILMAGFVAASTAGLLGGGLNQILNSQDSVWIVVISIYLILVATSSRDTLTPSLKVFSIPLIAILLLAGLGTALTPITGTFMPPANQRTVDQPAQLLPLLMSFAVFSGWPWLAMEKMRRPTPWMEYGLGVLAVSLATAAAVEATGFEGFRTSVESVLAHLFGDFAKPVIGRVYGLTMSLAGLMLVTASLRYIVDDFAFSGAGLKKQAMAAAWLIPIYFIAMMDSWGGILTYAGGLGLVFFSIMLVKSAGGWPATFMGLGIYVYSASTLTWLALTELGGIAGLEALTSAAPPILSLAGSAIGGFIIVEMVSRSFVGKAA